jgi:serine/threonine protein kinase
MSTEPDNPHRCTEPAGPPLPLFGMEDDHIPDRLGKFKILDLVAKSMALVFKAEQESPHRIVALKIPRGGKLLSPAVRQRFLREVQHAAAIDHAGIVPVLETGEIDGVPYYTMPFVEGRALQDHVTAERLSLDDRLKVFLRVCQVVQALHEKRLVHRDLKPDNIMIDRHGEVRLLDFGLSKAWADVGERLTTDQGLLGTLQFMAPEQTEAGKQHDIAPAADVYALAVILYCLLTDQYPYDVSGSREAALETIRTVIPAPPSTRNPTTPARFDAVALACLRKDPQARPQTAGELVKLFRAVMDNQPIALPPAVPAGTGVPPGRRRLLPILVIAAGCVALVVGLLAAFRPQLFRANVGATFLSRPSSEQPQPAVSTDSSLLPPPSSSQIFSPSDIAANSGQSPITAHQSPVPTDLWGIYNQVKETLGKFEHARRGAVIVRPGHAASAAFLTYQVEGEVSSREQTIEPGGVVVLYLPGAAKCRVECVADGHILRRTVTAPSGEVVFIELR